MATRKVTHFSGELSAAHGAERARLAAGDADDFECAVEDDEDTGLRIALVGQDVAGSEVPTLTERGQESDLPRLQRREHRLVTVGRLTADHSSTTSST